MTKQDVLVHQQADYAILLAKDHFHGVEVQLVKYVDSSRLDEKGETITTGKVGHVVWKKFVATTSHNPSMGEAPKLVAPEEFKRNLDQAEQEARTQLGAYFISSETMIDGALNDFRSKHQSLNSTEAV